MGRNAGVCRSLTFSEEERASRALFLMLPLRFKPNYDGIGQCNLSYGSSSDSGDSKLNALCNSDILVLKIILVLVFIQFGVNNFYFSFSFSFEIILVSISVLVSVFK